jgi:mono/diheme cytochrome c family protein
MWRKVVVLLLAAFLVGAGLFWFVTEPASVSASALPAYVADATRGRTVFNAGGCSSCHAAPDQDDRTVLGGGLAIPSPFGTFYAPNISQNPVDGIGRWTEANFVTAMWKGTSPGDTHYFPAFPYTSYQRVTLEDVRDLFAYLKTLPQAAGKVRDHDVAFPFNIRRLVGGWKFLFLDGKRFAPDPTKSAEWNRGAYLVNGPGHCAECHSPRNFLGGIIASQRFAGGPDLEHEGGWVPNITQKGLSDWSEQDIQNFLEDGATPDGDSVSGSMKRVIKNTSQLSDADRKAIAAYLKSLPPVEGPARPARKS